MRIDSVRTLRVALNAKQILHDRQHSFLYMLLTANTIVCTAS